MAVALASYRVVIGPCATLVILRKNSAHNFLGGAVPEPSRSSDGPCYRAATHARDSSVDSAHLDTATATLITLVAPCALADLS